MILKRGENINSLKSYLESYGIKNNEDFRYIYLNEMKTSYICDIYGNIYNTKRKGNGYEKVVFKKISKIKLPNDYFVVSLSIDGHVIREYVHRLIAKTFISIPDKYTIQNLNFDDLEVNHKNGDKSDNSIYNLEWVTSSDNKIHAYQTNLAKQGEESCKSIYSKEQIHQVCKLIEQNELGPTEISELTGVSKGQIYDIRNKGSWISISSLYDFSQYTPKQQKYSENQLSNVIYLICENKMSVKEISKITGVHEKTVYKYKEKYHK